MDAADARAMVAAMFWYASEAKQKAISQYMVQENTNALHAAWTLYGRPRGYPCTCAPCVADPPIGSEVVMRILMHGRGELLSPADNGPG